MSPSLGSLTFSIQTQPDDKEQHENGDHYQQEDDDQDQHEDDEGQPESENVKTPEVRAVKTPLVRFSCPTPWLLPDLRAKRLTLDIVQ